MWAAWLKLKKNTLYCLFDHIKVNLQNRNLIMDCHLIKGVQYLHVCSSGQEERLLHSWNHHHLATGASAKTSKYHPFKLHVIIQHGASSRPTPGSLVQSTRHTLWTLLTSPPRGVIWSSPTEWVLPPGSITLSPQCGTKPEYQLYKNTESYNI